MFAPHGALSPPGAKAVFMGLGLERIGRKAKQGWLLIFCPIIFCRIGPDLTKNGMTKKRGPRLLESTARQGCQAYLAIEQHVFG